MKYLNLTLNEIRNRVVFVLVAGVHVFKGDEKNTDRKRGKIFLVGFKNAPTVGRKGARSCV